MTAPALLLKAAPFYVGQMTDGGEVRQIELRTDGFIYVFCEGREDPWKVLSAYNCVSWEHMP